MNDEERKAELALLRKTGLALLREPFPQHQISKLPKPTKAQTEAVKANYKEGIRCDICGTWHHPKVVHLDYVGHAALTDRLLDADAQWNWEPVATTPDGSPMLDKDGGMWIRLTVCGVTRLGYGDAEGKTGPAAMKERIGDALRNAAMRFGAALDLWHKGDLHLDDDEPQKRPERPALPPYPNARMAENMPKWREKIIGGEFPANIISMVATKYTLTDEQKRQIMALAADPETGEIGDPMKITFAQLAGRFQKAKDIDMLDADADLIQHVEDAAQRGELKDMHKKRRTELEAKP